MRSRSLLLLALALLPRVLHADPADEPKPAEQLPLSGDRNAPADVGNQPMDKKINASATVNPDQAAIDNTGKAWSILASTITSVGIGTFVKNFYASDPYVDQSLYLEPAYVLKLPRDYKIRFSARESLDFEFTKPDNPSNRYFNWSDITLGASGRIYHFARTEIDLWSAVRMTLPVSAQSQQAGLITALIPSVGASRNFEWTVRGGHPMSFFVRYDFGVRKNFDRTNVPTYSTDPNTAVVPTIVMRSSDAYADGGLAHGNASVDFSLSNALLLSFTPHPLIVISAYAGIANAFKYAVASSVDAFTSPYAKAGAGRADEMRTNIDITINLPSHLFLGAGIFTVEPVFAPNNHSLYDPLFNTDSAASNYTTFYLSFAGQI